MKVMISTLSLAVSLALAGPAAAHAQEDAAVQSDQTAAPTAADADAFIAAAEKDLFAYRSEEHTSELQSLMRISYAVFFLTKTNNTTHKKHTNPHIQQH